MSLKSEFTEVNRACWALDHNTRLDFRHELFLWDVGLHPSSNPSPNPPVFLPILCCCFLDHGLLCTIALGCIQKGEALSLLFSLVMIFFYGAGDMFGHKNVFEIWYLLLGFRIWGFLWLMFWEWSQLSLVFTQMLLLSCDKQNFPKDRVIANHTLCLFVPVIANFCSPVFFCLFFQLFKILTFLSQHSDYCWFGFPSGASVPLT